MGNSIFTRYEELTQIFTKCFYVGIIPFPGKKRNPHLIVFQQIWLWNRVLTRAPKQKVQNNYVVL